MSAVAAVAAVAAIPSRPSGLAGTMVEPRLLPPSPAPPWEISISGSIGEPTGADGEAIPLSMMVEVRDVGDSGCFLICCSIVFFELKVSLQIVHLYTFSPKCET